MNGGGGGLSPAGRAASPPPRRYRGWFSPLPDSAAFRPAVRSAPLRSGAPGRRAARPGPPPPAGLPPRPAGAPSPSLLFAPLAAVRTQPPSVPFVRLLGCFRACTGSCRGRQPESGPRPERSGALSRYGLLWRGSGGGPGSPAPPPARASNACSSSRSLRACPNSRWCGSPFRFWCTVWWLEGIASSSCNCSIAGFFQKTGSCCNSKWTFRCAVYYVDQATDPGNTAFAVDWGLTVRLTLPSLRWAAALLVRVIIIEISLPCWHKILFKYRVNTLEQMYL